MIALVLKRASWHARFASHACCAMRCYTERMSAAAAGDSRLEGSGLQRHAQLPTPAHLRAHGGLLPPRHAHAVAVCAQRVRCVRRPSALSALRLAQTLLSHHLELTVFDDNHPDLNFYFGTAAHPLASLQAGRVCSQRSKREIVACRARRSGAGVSAALGQCGTGPMLLA